MNHAVEPFSLFITLVNEDEFSDQVITPSFDDIVCVLLLLRAELTLKHFLTRKWSQLVRCLRQGVYQHFVLRFVSLDLSGQSDFFSSGLFLLCPILGHLFLGFLLDCGGGLFWRYNDLTLLPLG